MTKRSGKRPGRPPNPAGLSPPVRIDKDIYTMAKNLAGYRGTSTAEYLSGILRPIVTRDYRAMVKEMDKAAGESET